MPPWNNVCPVGDRSHKDAMFAALQGPFTRVCHIFVELDLQHSSLPSFRAITCAFYPKARKNSKPEPSFAPGRRGEGSCCSRVRRLGRPASVLLGVPEPPMKPKSIHHSAGRILLAEDDEAMRNFLARALTKAGYDVSAFGDGAEAFESLMEEPYTLLLTDITMPQMDGIELARRAAALDPDLKIMFITGFAAVSLNTAAAPRDSKVLSKPFHLRDLVREVDRLLAA